ncbi:MAG: acetyl-CoA carboxylase biotin carboxyl carrier protein [Ktedonobacteraceae bacterium]
MDREKKATWLERVEEIIDVLEGSTIGELELTEDGTEIIIRRQPGLLMSTLAPSADMAGPAGVALGSGRAGGKPDKSIPVTAPLTGVYYSAASPTSPSFANPGDVIQVGQTVALIEAMKVFNEIAAEVAGRVVALVAKNGEVIQKGDVILRVEPV